jgi:HlyD family secretion protein
MIRSGILLLLAAFAAILTVTCSLLPGAGPQAEAATSASVQAVRSEIDFYVPAKGYLEATDASPIAVPRVPTGAMMVKEVADEGSIVEEGEIVLVFDDTQLNIQLDNHQATFRSANRRIDKTKIQSNIDVGSLEVMKNVAELERDNVEAFKIADEAIFSQLEILEEEVKKEEAGATIVYADAGIILKGEYYDIEERILDVEKKKVGGDMGRVETSLGNLVLKAPIGGLILYKKNWRGGVVSVGDTLWPGNLVLSIVDPASAALKAFVLEKDAAGVKEGAEAIVTIDARADRKFIGKVKTIAEISRPIESNSPVKYSEVLIEIENPDISILKPGMKGEALIRTGGSEDTVVIPRSALRGEKDAHFVLVRDEAEPDGRARRAVTIGPGDLARISVTEGLDGGEMVLVGGESGEAPEESQPDDAGPEPAATIAAGP